MGYGQSITDHPNPNVVHTAIEIDEILADLNATVTGLTSLRVWASQTDLPIVRFTHGAELTSVRLAGHDEHGDPVAQSNAAS